MDLFIVYHCNYMLINYATTPCSHHRLPLVASFELSLSFFDTPMVFDVNVYKALGLVLSSMALEFKS